MGNRKNPQILTQLLLVMDQCLKELEMEIGYYHASVYKAETARNIKLKIDEISRIILATQIPTLLEPIYDYEAELHKKVVQPLPGECSFVTRVLSFIRSLQKEIHILKEKPSEKTLEKNRLSQVKECKPSILSLCKLGDEHWSFFSKML